MKMYTVKKGIEAIALLNPMDRDNMKSKQHFTTRGWNFFDTLIDPVSLHNGRTCGNDVLDGLAGVGYAVFLHPENTKYALAVRYDQVEVA